jgi:O-antigen ligase
MVTPYGINDLAPLGYNHNLIAEVLIPIIPLGAWLAFEAYRANEPRQAWWYVIGTSVVVVAELLTLSRAGWISLAVQSALGMYFFRNYLRKFFDQGMQYLGVVVPAVLGVFAVYMIRFLIGSSAVSGSNFARLVIAEITQFYFLRAPILGYGPGMYIPVFQNTHEYIFEFGDALEAHGMIQKVLLETGVLGFVFFAGTLGLILHLLWKHARQPNHTGEVISVLCSMVIGAMTFQLFNTSYFTSVMWMPIGVALSGAYLYIAKPTGSNSLTKDSTYGDV